MRRVAVSLRTPNGARADVTRLASESFPTRTACDAGEQLDETLRALFRRLVPQRVMCRARVGVSAQLSAWIAHRSGSAHVETPEERPQRFPVEAFDHHPITGIRIAGASGRVSICLGRSSSTHSSVKPETRLTL